VTVVQTGPSPVTFNAASYLVARHVQEGSGHRVAVHGSDRSLTYAELHELVSATAAGLRALGLHRGERVVFVMADDIELLAGILGAFWAGLVAVPVSTMLGGAELGTILADSGARVVVTTHEFAANACDAAAAAPELEQLVLHGDAHLTAPGHIRSSTWEQMLALGSERADSHDGPAATIDDSWALWLYTSGTTGTPKAAMHRHANIRHVCETYAAQVLGIRPDDRCLSVAKLFFAYGIGNSAFFPLAVGAETVLERRRPSPEIIAEDLTIHRPTLFFGVPTFFAALTSSSIPDEAFRSVRLAASAGESLPAVLQERFTQRFGVDIIDGIGSTEALHIFLSNRPDDIRPGTTGLPVPGYDLELRDASGAVVAPGTPGHLYVRGESIATGYWQRTQASRLVFQGEWLRTGDTYVESADGYFTCLGRSNDMIKAGGIWVSPAEVESRLLQHPAVAEVAVVAVADEEGLDKPVAAVVRSGQVTADELVNWCREGLAAFKRPRAVVFVDELPKTATGKMQRFRVREMMSGQQEGRAAPAVTPLPVPHPTA
jgi:benzoate-CoA ligase family protein